MSVNLIESRMYLFTKLASLLASSKYIFFTTKWDEKKRQQQQQSGMLLHTFLSFHLCIISLAGKKEVLELLTALAAAS